MPESVWDYPRPPRVEPDSRLVTIELGGVEIVRTVRALRVLETSHPPAFYVPQEDIRHDALEQATGRSFCEFKGFASYWDVIGGEARQPAAAWGYLSPNPQYASLANHLSFYPGRIDRCTVGGETVKAQEGDFYGGWITSEIEGPFKGAPGTLGW